MGYTTEFQGQFILNTPFDAKHKAYLLQFAETRRMRRDALVAETLPDPLRLDAGLPIGYGGGYFVGATGSYGQDWDESIVDYNNPPMGQPGLWCKWAPSEDGTAIAWDGEEKFYDYVEWLQYLIDHFLTRWGYILNGDVSYRGEEFTDVGVISVTDNYVVLKQGVS